jgi:hypothetical protein
LLEKIKHVFEIPNIFFIIATDTKQLCHSIQAIYGQNFDSHKYLKRFFDQEYLFEDPNYHQFADHLFNIYNLIDTEKLYSPFVTSFSYNKNPNIECFALLSSLFNLKLRDQHQCCDVLSSIVMMYELPTLHMFYLLFLIMLKHSYLTIFEELCGTEINLNIDDILTNFEKDKSVNNKLQYQMHKSINSHSQEGDGYVMSLIRFYLNLSKMKRSAIVREEEATADSVFKATCNKLINCDPKYMEFDKQHDLHEYCRLVKKTSALRSV